MLNISCSANGQEPGHILASHPYLTFITILWYQYKYYYHPQFTEKAFEAQGNEIMYSVPHHSASNCTCSNT